MFRYVLWVHLRDWIGLKWSKLFPFYPCLPAHPLAPAHGVSEWEGRSVPNGTDSRYRGGEVAPSELQVWNQHPPLHNFSRYHSQYFTELES